MRVMISTHRLLIIYLIIFVQLKKHTYPTQLEEFKMKTTPKEKMIIGLMEEVINILSTCKLGDPEFDMYDVMKDAVEKEVRYPLYD